MADLVGPRQGLAEPGLHGLRLGCRGRRLGLVPPAESINPAGGVYQTLLPRKVGMALRAHLDVNRGCGRAGLELVTAGALNHELAVVRV
jgi:hypothetical protein